MDVKRIGFVLLISALLMGSVCAANGVNDFKVDKSYENVFNCDYFSVYANSNQDSGVAIYKDVDDDAYDNVSDDAVDNLVHDDGREYITPDDDMQIDKKSDNSVVFTDVDDAEHGVAEMIKINNESYIVVFWAKDSSNITNSDLNSLLKEFNGDNDVEAVAF